MSYPNQTMTTDHPQPPQKNKKVWIIIGVVAFILVICFCLAAAAALLYFDPFDWGILGRLTGGYDSIARTVSADAQMHLSVDMLKLLSNDTQDIVNAFAQAGDNPEVQSREDLIKQMDESLLEQYGVTFTDDIKPWIGQYAGVSLFDINLNESNDTPTWVFAIEARDKKAADAFVAKITAHLANESGTSLREIEYKNTTFFEIAMQYDSLAIGRYKGLVFLSSEMDHIIRAIDAPDGKTLAKDDGYRAITKELPSTRIMTTFINQTFFKEIYALNGGEIAATGLDPKIFGSSGMSLSLVNNSIQLDAISAYNREQLSEPYLNLLSSRGTDTKILEEFPQDTILFMGGSNLGKIYSSVIEILSSTNSISSQEVSESMQLLDDQIGFNPETDLLPYLDGDWGLALVKERDTLLAKELNIPVGVMGIFQTSNNQQLSQNLSETADQLSKLGIVAIEEKIIDDMTLYVASIFMMDGPLFAFGMQNNQMLLGTNSTRFENPPERNQSLAESEQWKEAWKMIPRGMTPTVYLDFQGFIHLIPDFSLEELQYLQPIDRILMADSPLKNNLKHTVLVITIKTEE